MKRHNRPHADEYSTWYANYVNRVTADDVISALTASHKAFDALWPELHIVGADFAYAPDKWSVAQLLRHLIDSEWIFAYRALRFARNDNTELPGYDHDAYAVLPVDETLEQLKEQMEQVRTATTGLFMSFPESGGLLAGTANGNLCSVRALGFIIAGHQLHHLDILKERYLPAAQSIS
jgi:hypothetical protein